MNANVHDLSYSLNLYRNMQVTHAVHKYYCGIYTYKYIHTNSNHEKKRILEQIWFNCDSENLLQASLVFFTVLV